MAEVISWKEECWQRVATADVEDGGAFYECVIYQHKVGGGHCLYFGEEEYEGMGEDQSCGVYSFKDGVLKDQDGDSIQVRNVVVGRLPTRDYVPSSSSDEESECEEVIPVYKRGRVSGRGTDGQRTDVFRDTSTTRGGRSSGRGRASGRGRTSGRGRGRGRGRTSSREISRGRDRAALPAG